MTPKCILIKSQNQEFINSLLYKLQEMQQIRFFCFKINGFYTVTIKCHNYYNIQKNQSSENIYGNYVFLYSLVAIILADLLLTYYENILVHHILTGFDIKKKQEPKLSYISALLLDENSPFTFSNLLYKRRKNYLLCDLFENFRKRNFIFIDYFLDFNSPKYRDEIVSILELSSTMLKDRVFYNYVMNFIDFRR